MARTAPETARTRTIVVPADRADALPAVDVVLGDHDPEQDRERPGEARERRDQSDGCRDDDVAVQAERAALRGGCGDGIR